MVIVHASNDYIEAMDELAAAEAELLEHARRVEVLREGLPLGPAVDPGTPLTAATGKPITLGSLLGERRRLLGYHLAFDEGEGDAAPDRWVDVVDALVPHIEYPVVVLSPASPGELARVGRRWRNVRVVSTQPGALTEELRVRGAEAGLVATVTWFALDGDGVLRVRWQGRPGWGVLDVTCRNSVAVGR